MSSYLAEPLLKECYKEAIKVGAFPELRAGINGTKKFFMIMPAKSSWNMSRR